MSDSKFRWYSEENGDEPQQLSHSDKLTPTPFRRPLFLFLIFLLVGSSGFLVYQRLNQQLVETSTTIKQDVRASHRLLRRAAAAADLELFITALSGSDLSWADAQQQLVQEGGFLDRPAFGFDLASSASAPIPNVSLNPALNTAVLTYTAPYLTVTPSGVTETIRLQHTAVYRRGSQNWLLAPPGADFWGETMIQRGRYLTLHHPARDEAIAARLAADLDQAVGQLCRTPQFPCPAQPFPVHLDPHPSTLATLGDPKRLWQQSVSRPLLALPSPTLVGTPVDDTAYRALFRGYARPTLTTIILHGVGYQCCHGQIFYRALLDRILSDVGLAPPPLTPADYQRLLEEEMAVGPAVISLSSLWETPLSRAQADERASLARALIAFAAENHPVLNPYALLASLAATDDYTTWTRPFLTTQIQNGSALQTLDGRWFRFLYRRAAVAATPPIPWPNDQVTQLLCQGNLAQHDAAENRFSFLIGDGVIHRVASLAGRQGVFWFGQRRDDGESAWQVGVSRPDQVRTLYTRPAAPSRSHYAATLDANGRYALIHHTDLTGGDRPAQRFNYSFIDLAACAAGAACPPQPLPAPAVWSPDGAHTILWYRSPHRPPEGYTAWHDLALGNGQGEQQQTIGPGQAATWLDKNSFALLGVDNAGERMVYKGTVDDPSLRPLLALSEVNALVSLEEEKSLRPHALFAHPAAPHQIWLLVEEWPDHNLHLVSYNEQTEQTTLRLTVPITNSVNRAEGWGYRFSPAGERLALLFAVRDVTRNEIDFRLYLHDLAGEKSRAFSLETTADFFMEGPNSLVLDWSENGRWLAVPAGKGYQLIHPETGYQHSVITGYNSCTAVAWVNK